MEEQVEMPIIAMTDEETGEEINFAIIDAVEYNKQKYILVVEEDYIEDDEAEAIVLKVFEDPNNKEDFYYQTITDEEEFAEIQDVFMEKDIDEFEVTAEE